MWRLRLLKGHEMTNHKGFKQFFWQVTWNMYEDHNVLAFHCFNMHSKHE